MFVSFEKLEQHREIEYKKNKGRKHQKKEHLRKEENKYLLTKRTRLMSYAP